ncbi:unnamed protein product [Dibothriocephalus latus]|uniref:Protein kinase domain-containing protein n=1 Tax=Dibothriocephalus latus TaxID=60516 RepID=A0A3P7NKW5_DIBLA|nr:unnamed protein product [Dibothriocephalus latus]
MFGIKLEARVDPFSPYNLERVTTPMYRAPEMLDLYQNYPINEAGDVWVCLQLLDLFVLVLPPSHPPSSTLITWYFLLLLLLHETPLQHVKSCQCWTRDSESPRILNCPLVSSQCSTVYLSSLFCCAQSLDG